VEICGRSDNRSKQKLTINGIIDNLHIFVITSTEA
jgi:hypothetical protein